MRRHRGAPRAPGEPARRPGARRALGARRRAGTLSSALGCDGARSLAGRAGEDPRWDEYGSSLGQLAEERPWSVLPRLPGPPSPAGDQRHQGLAGSRRGRSHLQTIKSWRSEYRSSQGRGRHPPDNLPAGDPAQPAPKFESHSDPSPYPFANVEFGLPDPSRPESLRRERVRKSVKTGEPLPSRGGKCGAPPVDGRRFFVPGRDRGRARGGAGCVRDHRGWAALGRSRREGNLGSITPEPGRTAGEEALELSGVSECSAKVVDIPLAQFPAGRHPARAARRRPVPRAPRSSPCLIHVTRGSVHTREQRGCHFSDLLHRESAESTVRALRRMSTDHGAVAIGAVEAP